jgi:hypothetical protein
LWSDKLPTTPFLVLKSRSRRRDLRDLRTEVGAALARREKITEYDQGRLAEARPTYIGQVFPVSALQSLGPKRLKVRSVAAKQAP